MPVETIIAAKEFIEKWVNDRGYPMTDVPHSDDYSFQFGSISAIGIGFVIVQPKTLKRVVVVATHVEFSPFHLEALESAPDRADFLWKLREHLVSASPAFSFNDPKNPTGIEFSREISFDELTEGRLQDAVDQTVRCVLWVSWLFLHRFGISKEIKE
jgi:hypothetical protein